MTLTSVRPSFKLTALPSRIQHTFIDKYIFRWVQVPISMCITIIALSMFTSMHARTSQTPPPFSSLASFSLVFHKQMKVISIQQLEAPVCQLHIVLSVLAGPFASLHLHLTLISAQLSKLRYAHSKLANNKMRFCRYETRMRSARSDITAGNRVRGQINHRIVVGFGKLKFILEICMNILFIEKKERKKNK